MPEAIYGRRRAVPPQRWLLMTIISLLDSPSLNGFSKTNVVVDLDVDSSTNMGILRLPLKIHISGRLKLGMGPFVRGQRFLTQHPCTRKWKQ